MIFDVSDFFLLDISDSCRVEHLTIERCPIWDDIGLVEVIHDTCDGDGLDEWLAYSIVNIPVHIWDHVGIESKAEGWQVEPIPVLSLAKHSDIVEFSCTVIVPLNVIVLFLIRIGSASCFLASQPNSLVPEG